MHAVDSACHAFAGDIACDGTRRADERESFPWGFVHRFHAQVHRLDRAVDALKPRRRDLERAQDGAGINACELECTVGRARAPGDRRDAFEKMRDHAADAYRTGTGSTWRPRRGSHVSQTGTRTAAAIDARDDLCARAHRANEAHLPDGALVAVAGGKEADNVHAICRALDRVKERPPDMVRLHGGGPGAERIAAHWADSNAVHQVVFGPDRDAHGRAAPCRRNDPLLERLPTGLVAFPGGGIGEHLVDQGARARHARLRDQPPTRIARQVAAFPCRGPSVLFRRPRTPRRLPTGRTDAGGGGAKDWEPG